MCRVLGVSPSGYWAWRRREPSARAHANAQLTDHIVQIHQASRGTYGARRVRAELVASGISCGHTRVARLMRQAGLVGCHRRRPVHTTRRDPAAEPAPDLVQRAFRAPAPNQLWWADITYVPTEEGFLYLAVILDGFSRRVVGWSMQEHLRTELVLAAASDGGLEPAAQGGADSPLGSRLEVTRRCSSASAARRWGSSVPWAPWETVLTTPWRRASLPP
jgi:putative transposase